MFQTLLFACGAGVLGTGLGGIIGIFFRHSPKAVVSYLLAFASGVMVSIVCFDLVPEALELAGIFQVALCILLGVLAVRLLNSAIDRLTNSRETHIQLEELRHQSQMLSNEGRQDMLRSGLVMFAAIALHNLPEGMAIGSGASHDAGMGLSLAILIALHNIPEGMSIGVPLIEGGVAPLKAVLITALSGLPTLVGGWIGAMLGNGGDALVSLSLALAAGAMLYVTYCEILPQVILLNRGRRPALFTIVGILFGLILTEILH